MHNFHHSWWSALPVIGSQGRRDQTLKTPKEEQGGPRQKATDSFYVVNIWVGLPWYLDFPGGLEGKAPAHNAGDPGSIPGLGKYPGEGTGNPLQYPCLEKSHERRSLIGYTLHGVAKSWTQRSDFTFTSLSLSLVAQSLKICLQCKRHGFYPWGWNNALEKEMAIHSCIIAWEIPWIEEPGRLQSMGSQESNNEKGFGFIWKINYKFYAM